jgi:wee1-like protein kinase
MYEAGGGGPLPKNGEEWHAVREGRLRELQQCSQDFNKLIKVRHIYGRDGAGSSSL